MFLCGVQHYTVYDSIVCWCLLIRSHLLEAPLLMSPTCLFVSPKYTCTPLSCCMCRSFRNPSEPSILSTTPPTELDVLWRRKPPWRMTTWNWMTCWVNWETNGILSVENLWRGKMFCEAVGLLCWTSYRYPRAMHFRKLKYVLCLGNFCWSLAPPSHSSCTEKALLFMIICL